MRAVLASYIAVLHCAASMCWVRVRGWGGGLTTRQKFVVTPPSLFSVEVGRKTGGGITVSEYGTCTRSSEGHGYRATAVDSC